jgi:hypothetical protein
MTAYDDDFLSDTEVDEISQQELSTYDDDFLPRGETHDHFSQQDTTATNEKESVDNAMVRTTVAMNRAAILRDLDSLIVARLFGSGRWLVDQEAAAALDYKLHQMGLQETLPNDSRTTRSTALGKELKSDLMMVFLGMWDEYEIPRILAEHDLLGEAECEDLEEVLYAGNAPECILRERVQKAYCSYYCPTGRLN